MIDVVESERLAENAREVGAYVLALAQELRAKHRIVGDVRGVGLFVGIELVKDRQSKEPATEEAKSACTRLKDSRIIVSVDGPYENVLKLKPPMVFTKDNAKFFVDTLNNILSTMK